MTAASTSSSNRSQSEIGFIFQDFSSIRHSFVVRLCYLSLVFAMFPRLFIAALWSPEGKGLTHWLLFMMFIVILLLSHFVSSDRYGT